MSKLLIIVIIIIAFVPALSYGLEFDPPLDEGIQFPETHVEEESIVEMTITNNANFNARVQFNAPNNRVFSIDPLEMQINGNQQVVVEFSFVPEEAGEISERINGTYSDGNEMRRFTIELRGVGIEGDPSISVEPVEVTLNLDEPGQHDEATITIGNSGETGLSFEIGFEEEIPWLEIDPMAGEVEVDEELELTVSTTDFVPVRGEHEAEVLIRSNDPENGEIAISIGLNVDFDPNLIVEPDEIEVSLETDSSVEIELEAANRGDDPLDFFVDRRLIGEADADPWELRSADNIEEIVADNMLNGVVLADGCFFVSGGNNGDDVSKIYILNTDGERIGEFDQFNESRYGMRDIAYDGALIWGADEGRLYGFTTEGELESDIDVPVDIECRSLTWDPDRNVLWASDIATDIYAIDRNGELVETFERPEEIRIYGLGYWQDDPDDCHLYIFCRGEDFDLQVNKINLGNGDFMTAAEIDVEGGRPGGVHVTNQLDFLSWVFVALVQNPDRIAIWQLAANLEWFRIEPTEGSIEADHPQELILTLDATGLPEESFQGELAFTILDAGGQVIIPVSLDVVEGRVHTSRDITLDMGWNLVSANLQPDDEENIEGLMASLVEDDLLVILKNSAGQFYRPDYEFNSIPGWYVDEGYQILMRSQGVLTLEGMSVLGDDLIDLEQGWQIVSYYPRFEIEATVALSGIVDHLIIAKDGRGNFYLPAWDFSNMGNMREGQGYHINVDADVELIYQTGDENAALSGGLLSHEPGYLPQPAMTGENMSLLVCYNPLLEGEVTVYASDRLVGRGVIHDGTCGIALWGDDAWTETVDGALKGEALTLSLYTGGDLRDAQYQVLAGEMVYKTDSYTVVSLGNAADIPEEFGIISASPNPFNSVTRITYTLPEASRISMSVYNTVGQLVSVLVDDKYEAGSYTATWDAESMATGVFFIRLEASGLTTVRKVVLMK